MEEITLINKLVAGQKEIVDRLQFLENKVERLSIKTKEENFGENLLYQYNESVEVLEDILSMFNEPGTTFREYVYKKQDICRLQILCTTYEEIFNVNIRSRMKTCPSFPQ